jgi:hypothetical protein
LINLAEVQSLTGKWKESLDYLGSAMKALKGHKNSAQGSPVLGKILRELAYYHMLNTQAVTAEGLFRSSLEKLEATPAAYDLR